MASLLWAAALFNVGTGVRRGRQSHRFNSSASVTTTDRSFHMRLLMQREGCEVLEAAWGQVHRLARESVVESKPEWVWKDLEEGDVEHSKDKFVDIWGPTEEGVHTRAQERCGGPPHMPGPAMAAIPEETEVRCIICNGDSSNRIDVVFMGDGYQLQERERFFEDMARLTKDMFEDVTFQSYLPVFNIWAIHVPSVDSGIGYYGRSKNTPFGLYKQGTQHRGVMPSRSGQQMARQVCQLAGGCDYPSIIGNDEFYGGLGGEFVIGTRSKTTGTIVLRHEMGHNFVSVGEEYDGGGVYRGVNAEGATFRGLPPSSIKWREWLAEPKEEIVEQRMKIGLQQYPWKDLAGGKQSFTFSSPGDFSRWKLTFTVSGLPEPGSLKVVLDGQPLDWQPTKPLGAERPDGHTVDRQFYYFGDETQGLSQGNHTLSFESAFAPPAGAPIRQICSVTLHEFGSEAEFNTKPGYVGAYPTWDRFGSKSFRPTNDQCLMRQMESTVFCSVCRQGMWQQFFSRMGLIDDVEVSGEGEQVTVQLKAVPLAHLRETPLPGLTESYTVAWFKNGDPQPQYAGKYIFSGSEAELAGTWAVELSYTTSEVRSDPNKLLHDRKTFGVGQPAGECPWNCNGFLGCGRDSCRPCECYSGRQ